MLGHFKASLDNFDRRFDSRVFEILEGPVARAGGVWMRWRATHRLAGVPDLVLEGEESAHFEGDRIRRLEDRIPAWFSAATRSFLAEHGSKLRPVGD